jgi:hypothetical protein
MALTPSNNFQKGISAPKFTLVDTISEKVVSLDELKGRKEQLFSLFATTVLL